MKKRRRDEDVKEEEEDRTRWLCREKLLPRKPDPRAHDRRRELTPEACHLTSTVVQPPKSSMPCAYTWL